MTTLQGIKNGERFWLAKPGTEQIIHEIGPYALVEFTRKEGDKSYSVFIDGQSVGHSFNDFETALAHAMAVKFDGLNTQAGVLFGKMIKGIIPGEQNV